MNMPTFTRDYLQLLPLATGESDPENVSSFTTLRFPRQCITFNSFFLSLSGPSCKSLEISRRRPRPSPFHGVFELQLGYGQKRNMTYLITVTAQYIIYILQY